jgi:hypothetical protein
VSVRRVADQTLTSGTEASEPHHRGGGADLVDRHQSCGVRSNMLCSRTQRRRRGSRRRAFAPPCTQCFFKGDAMPFVETPYRRRLPEFLAVGIATTISSRVKSGLFSSQRQQKPGMILVSELIAQAASDGIDGVSDRAEVGS